MMRERNTLKRLARKAVSFLLVWSLLLGFAPSGMMTDAGEDGITLAPNLEMIENDDGSVTIQAKPEDESDTISGVESDIAGEGESAEDAEPSEGETPENGEPSEDEVPESEPADSEAPEEEIDEPSDLEPEPEDDEPEVIRRSLGGAKLRGLLGSGAVEWIDLPVAYLDEYGASLLHSDCIKVTSDSTTWGAEGYAAWYAVTEDVTVASRITVNGDVYLILADGATLTASQGINVGEGTTLTIYGQTGGTGTLNATKHNGGAGIGGNDGSAAGTVVINGGVINAITFSGTGNGNVPGIGSGNNGTPGTVIINGGTVTATGQGQDGASAGIGGGGNRPGGTIIITGGTVRATGGGAAAGIGGGGTGGDSHHVDGGSITISGGDVVAIGGSNGGAGIGGGSSINSLLSGTTRDGGTITITGGTVQATGGGSAPGIGGGVASSSCGSAGTVTITGGTVTATSTSGAGIGGGGTNTDGSVTVSGGTVTATGTAGFQCDDLTLTWTGDTFDSTEVTASSYSGTVTFEKPYVLKTSGATADATNAAGVAIVPGAEALSDPIPYLDEHGDTQNCTSYRRLSEALTNGSILVSGWYVVDEDITYSTRITCSGDVHLILCDGMTLTANLGIRVTNSSLSIYSQKIGDGMGRLVAKGGQNAAIGLNLNDGDNRTNRCTVTINGGDIDARTSGSYCGAGIGGANHGDGAVIVINNGHVYAYAPSGAAGIGGGFNRPNYKVTINGGVVEAKSAGRGSGIGGGWYCAGGSITITNGVVTAVGQNGSTGIGGGSTNQGNAGSAGTIRITGGTVRATSANGTAIGGGKGSSGVNRAGTVAITGGTVTANDSGIGIVAGSLSFGWTADTYSSTSITASSYQVSSVTFSQPYVLRSDPATLASYTDSATNNMAGATIVPGGPPVVHYLDYNTSTRSMERQAVADYTILTEAYLTENSNALTSGWYVVESDVTASARITCSGNVHLILCDGATLTASQGINVPGETSLSIYAQKVDETTDFSTNTAGKLVATYANAGAAIGGNSDAHTGTIIINGGYVKATHNGPAWDKSGAGIGGGGTEAAAELRENDAVVIVNGGTVAARGGCESSGIGGGAHQSTGTVTIHGGIVTATGGTFGAGIGGGSHSGAGSVTVTGGTVTATGGEQAAGIGGGGSLTQAGAGSTVHISGGTVQATEGDGAAGIGGGQSEGNTHGGGGAVTITGGTVTTGKIGGGGSNTSGTLTLDWSGTGASGGLPRVTASSYQVATVTYAAAGRTFANLTAPGTALTVDQIKSLTNATILPTQTSNGVYYLDEDGAGQVCSTYNTVTSGTTSLTAGWWVVSADTTVSSRITCTGEVHLILCDGATLTASAGMTVRTGNALTIYAQSTSESTMGALNATGPTDHAAIGGNNGSHADRKNTGATAGDAGAITIVGGVIVATGSGGSGAAGIGGGHVGDGGTVTIYNGKVTAAGSGVGGTGIGSGLHGSGGTVDIRGGVVIATGTAYGAGIGTGGTDPGGITASARLCAGGTVTITGGTVTATAGARAAAIGSGCSLGSSDVITGGNITITGGTINATGQIGGGGSDTSGTLTLDWSSAGAAGGLPRITASSYQVETVTYANADHTFVNASAPSEALTVDQIKALTNATIVPTRRSGDDRGIYYLDANGDMQLCANYTSLTGEETALSAGWYAVTESVTLPARITCSGDVHLILCNGKTLTATNGGIAVNTPNSLSIYAQSTDAAVMGALTAKAVMNDYGHASGIGGNYGVNTGTITINGGRITSTGTNINGKPTSGDHGGAGIGGSASRSGGDITINGGIVTATGSLAAGIGGGEWAQGGNITINGGTVTAKGGTEGAGIGGGWDSTQSTANNITINGGTVTATGAGRGAGIGGGGRSNSTSGGQTGGTITINGGTVRAFSSTGAGIGGGNNSDYTSTTGTGGTITITGGDVTASTDNSYAAAIGGAGNASGGTITITGGTVNVTKDASGASVAGTIGGHGTGDGTLVLGWQNNDVAEGYPRITSSGYKLDTLTYQTDAGETECFAQEDDTSHSLLAKVDLNGFDTSTTIVPRQPNQMVVPYLDYVNGAMETRYCGEYTILTTEYLAANNCILTDGWYLSDGALTLDSDVLEEAELVTSGDVHLILMNDSNLNVRGVIVSEGNALAIYQQPESVGSAVGILTADRTTKTSSGACIGGGRDAANCDAGAITINGGIINALGRRANSRLGAGIGGGPGGKRGTILINAGTVAATGNGYSPGVGDGGAEGGSITINGGNITATGCAYASGIGGGVYMPGGLITITGGTITASTRYGGAGGGAGIGAGELRDGGTITITGGDITAHGADNGAGIGGGGGGGSASRGPGGSGGTITITGGTIRAYGGSNNAAGCGGGAGIGGGGRSIVASVTYAGGSAGTISITGGTIEAAGGTGGTGGAEKGSDIGAGLGATIVGTITLGSDNPTSGYPRITAQKYVGDLTLGVPFIEEGGTVSLAVDEILAFDARKTIYPAVSVANTVPYLDYVEGEMVTRYVVAPTALTAAYLSANSNTLTAGWYTVTGEVTATNRIICSDAVHLILKDGCTLTANAGINVTAGNALSIYAQSLGESRGQLIANSVDGNAGIGGNGGSSLGNGQTCGIVTINGGQIQATGGVGGSNKNAPGIGSGNNASGRGTVIINNGTVVARTGGAGTAAIGGGGNTPGCNVTIRGGTVDAQVGSVFGAAIGGGGCGAHNVDLSGGTVLISGGTVIATSAGNGAAIGGGGGGGGANNADLSGGTVLISGGTVIATSAGNGAAIGGGYCAGSGVNMSAGTITIIGGTVTANGKIGGGGSTATGTLTLGWADPDGISALPEITASSYQVDTVTYAVAGQAFGLKSSRETALTEAQIKALTNQTIIPAGVRYLDYVDGEMVEKWVGATPLTASYLSANSNTLAAGWYAVTSNVTTSAQVTCSGDVRLILCDGATLTATTGGIRVNSGNSLTIYAQSEDAATMGTLTATATAQHNAGIGGGGGLHSGEITINGGAITAVGGPSGNSGEGGAGIGGGSYGSGSVTIHGGIVDATGANAGAGIGGGCMAAGNVTITGGVIHARSSTNTTNDKNNGAAIGGGGGRTAGGSIAASNISISGGMVYAQAYGKGAGIGGAGAITGTYSPAGNIRITGGIIEAKSAKGSGIGGGALNSEIVPSGTLTLDWASDAATSCEPRITALSYAVETLTYANANHTFVLESSATDALALSTDEIKALTNSTIIPGIGGVKYLDYVDGEMVEKVRGTYTTLTADYLTEHNSTLSAGWYVVDSTFTYATRIVCDGDVHLILCDGTTLTASKGVSVNTGDSLTIYAQKIGTGMGALTATAAGNSGDSGIGGDAQHDAGTVTINGGLIAANGKSDGDSSGAGIGGGTKGKGGVITINGGEIQAAGELRGAGIGSGGRAVTNTGTVIINGGTVTARSARYGAGIGGGTFTSSGTIVIRGGHIKAYGGGNGAGIGSGSAGAMNVIEIHGGIIEAVGSADSSTMGGAGIGSGASSKVGGTITITGGEITATGSSKAAAIGGGYHSTDGASPCGTITITGGKIHAMGNATGVGIGPGAGQSNGTVHLGWTNDTFFTTEITASSYGGTVTFDRHYVQKNAEPETLAYWTSTEDNNIDGATIVPGINLMREVTLAEGRQYAAFTGGTENLTMPLNSAWTARINVGSAMDAINELNNGAAALSEMKAVFTQPLPANTVLTLTVVTGSGGSASYEHYYATLLAPTDTVRFTSFASMRNHGLRFRPSATDTTYLLSADFAPTGSGTQTDVGITFAATYSDGGGASRTATVSNRCKYSLVALGTLTAAATTVNVTAQPTNSALLSGKKVYLVGELPSELQMQYGSATYDGGEGQWISNNVIVFDLGTYESLSGVNTAKAYAFDWLGQSAGNYPITWRLRTGTSVWNIRGNQSVDEPAKVSGDANATVTASGTERPYLSATARTTGDRLYATGGQSITFNVATNRSYAWYVEKQTGLASFTQVSGAAYAQRQIAATTTSVTVAIPEAAGTYRVRFSMVNDDQTVNDNVYYTVVVVEGG